MRGLTLRDPGLVGRLRPAGYQTPAFVQSAANMVASGVATATLGAAATAGNLLIAVVGRGSGTSAIAGSGWSAIGSSTSGVALVRVYAKVAAGGETSASTTGVGANESIQFIEVSGATPVATGTPTVLADDAATHSTIVLSSTSPAVPAFLFAATVTNGAITSPSWTAGGLTLLDHTNIHSGYLSVAAGAYAATLTFTGTARRVAGVLVGFAAKTT